MFRPMRRFKQEVSREECINILTEEIRKDFSRVNFVEITIEHMTGKLVHEK